MPDSGDADVSRRELLQTTSLLGLAALGGPGLVGSPESIADRQVPFDFTKQSGALQPDAIVPSACQFCNSLCRLNVHLKDGRIIDVVGEKNDPVQDGGICVKGPMMAQLVYNRFRLHTPLKRVGGEKGSAESKFEPITWDEALDTIAGKFLALRDAGETHTIANKTSGRLPRGTGSLVGRFFTLLGMIGRPSVVHFAGVTQWTYTGKQLNGIRLIQIHPNIASREGIQNGDNVTVESPRGQVEGTALVWHGIREDTIFVPNTFGPMQKMGE